MRGPHVDMTGKKCGRLIVTRHVSKKQCEVVCECGTQRIVFASDLRRGLTRSCGCLKRDATIARNFRHGLSKTDLGRIYRGILTRCHNPNSKDYAGYGGAGVRIDPSWIGPGGLERFANHIGPRPSKSHSVDRFPDKFGNYAPGNVRWATLKEQARNKRTNRLVTMNGRTLPVAQWAEELGIELRLVWNRVRCGWSPDAALTHPVPSPGDGTKKSNLSH
jgi:hypothetical protein